LHFLQGDAEEGVDFLEFDTIILAGDVTPGNVFRIYRDQNGGPGRDRFGRSEEILDINQSTDRSHMMQSRLPSQVTCAKIL
jgi:hypothetical protein